MPRIAGVDVPKEKRLDVALTSLYGIGSQLSRKVLTQAQIEPGKRAKELTDDDAAKLTRLIQASYKVEGDLRREQSAHIKRLIDIGSYRGLRHKKGLPVRGQRTRTNARTRKGPRPRVGVRKKTRPGGPAPAAGAKA
ncbi:MAG: 30S ribosomal protein S13 [Candidatus Omnitrophica bacterium]|nr:30S ribosomal protein S13 [Candidatus Omnitrophota bacterium]